jgi:transposase InsO family protein
VSRQHFYELKKSYEEGGLEALKEKSRRVPNPKNRVAPETEAAVLAIAEEYPAYGQTRASNELRKRGLDVSPTGVRGVWMRHGLQTIKQRLRRLEAKAAAENLILTEAQVAALEQLRSDRESTGEEIETHHPGFLISQDTFYVGYLKGVGRIYQQTVVDTYSSVAFAKLHLTKTPLTAADTLNDRVLPFFEAEEVEIQRVLTDRGTEYCGRDDRHPYELFLELNEIEHTRTKARHPQTNGICERFHKTILGEFYQVAFRKKIYRSLEELQVDLDDWLVTYNQERSHQGKRCQGRTPLQTFLDSKGLVKEKMLA